MWFEQLIIHHHYVIYCLTNHITGGSDYSYNECVYYAVDVRCYDQLSFETSSFLPVADLTNHILLSISRISKKLAIWLPNRDCVQLTSENILFEQEYWCKCTDEIIFKLIFFVLISCTPRHFLFEIKWKCVCLSITCFFQRESLMLRISIFIFIARIQCRDWRNFLNFKVHLNGNRGETWVLHQEQQY